MKFYCDFFDIVICADDTKLHKPNPEPLLKYLEKSFLNNNEVLYVGGTIYDMKAANQPVSILPLQNGAI